VEPARDLRFGEEASEHLSLVCPLGRGGMASVWRAHHRDFADPVAVKFIPSDLAEAGEGHARLLREGRILARIESPRVVGLLAIHDDAPWPFLVLEELHGEVLARFAKVRSRVSLRAAARVIRGVGAAPARTIHGPVGEWHEARGSRAHAGSQTRDGLLFLRRVENRRTPEISRCIVTCSPGTMNNPG
jgi:aminoglycoside phosphotransferase (APT) family kinase protein